MKHQPSFIKIFNHLLAFSSFQMLRTLFTIILTSILMFNYAKSQTLVQVIDLPNNNFFNYGYGLAAKDGKLWISSSYSTGNLGARLYAVDTLGIVRDSVIFSRTHINSSQGLAFDGDNFYFVQRYTASCRIIRIQRNGQILDSLSWPASGIYLGGLGYDGQIWASVYFPNASAALYRIDKTSSQVLDTIPVFGLQPQGIAVKGDTIFYVMDGFDGDAERIYAVNRFTKDTLFSFHVPETPGVRQNPRGLAWDGNYLYLLAEPVGATSGRKIFKFALGGGSPSINVPTKFYDFGNIVLGTTAQFTATIHNQGTANLRIDSLRFFYSQRFLTSLTTPTVIYPGSFINLQISFSPIIYGPDSSHLYIYHNDQAKPAQVIRLSGTGVYGAGVISVPSNYDFGLRRVGSNFFRWMKIENLSTQSINIFGWSTSRQEFYLDENVFPATIPAHGFRYIRVWFKPQSAALITDTLKIFNNSSNAPEAKVFLSGFGEIQNVTLGQPLWIHTIPNHPISNTFRTVKGVRAINDITGDGKADVIVSTENYWTVALNGNSSGGNDTLWAFNTYISSSSAGSIGTTGDYSYQKALSIVNDLNGDGFNDVVIGTGGGNETVYALNGKTGRMLWKFGTDHPDSFALGDFTGVDGSTDFNGDGVPDVIAAASATQSGGVGGRRSVYLFNGTNGQIVWQRFVGGFTHAVTAISDINNDNISDVIVTVGEPVYQFQALSGANGNLLWTYSVSSSTGGAKEVIVYPIPGQRPDVIAGAFWGPIYRLKGTTGIPLWTYSTGGGAPTQMKILRDVNNDGFNEIVVSILAGGAACIDGATGNQLWFKSTGNTMGVDVIPDLNGDGSDDVVFAVQYQGALIVNGSNGNELAIYSFGGSTQAREVAVVPDIDNNGSREIIVGSNLGNVALISGGTVIQPASVQVLSPNGGEIWYINQQKKIRWTSFSVSNVKIEISYNNGGSWSLIATVSAQSGEYIWTVSGVASNQCRLKISSVENPNVFDLSDDIFIIRNELCINFNVNQHWNIVSVPVTRSNMTKNELFPGASSPAYGFNQVTGYVIVDTLLNSKGYWLKFPSSQQITICGLPVESNHITVNQGWNLIGAFENDINVSSLSTNPPNILQSYFFGYNSGYFIANQLQKGKGYWIKASQPGQIIFSNVANSPKWNLKSIDKILENTGEIIFLDKKNREAKLFLIDKDLEAINFELPPLPPSQAFDVRFNSGRFVEKLNKQNIILIQSDAYPIIIRSSKYILKIESEDVFGLNEIINPNDELVIFDEKIKSLKVTPILIPEKTELYQNYPNPFNPITKIRFDLRNNSRVQLKLFDMLGREIITLIDEERQPGIYYYEFNPGKFNLTSGVYFYQLCTEDYRSIKKMIYLR